MLDERTLTFVDAQPRSNGEAALFRGWNGATIVSCAISREALEDHFDGDNKDLLKVFKANHERIEHEARRKYLAGQIEKDLSVLIRTLDL